MPTTFSKPISHETAYIKRTYEEPIPFIPQADKGNTQKPKEIKIKLRKDPTDPNSTTVNKVFNEFVENFAGSILSMDG